MNSRTGLIMLSVFLSAVQAPGSTVFDQTTVINGNGFSIFDSRLADDFTLASATTIQAISFDYIFSEGGSTSDLSNVSYAIYANNARSLGALIHGQNNLAVLGSGASSNVCPNCALATFAISSVEFANGTSWPEIHPGTSPTDGTN